MPSCEQGAVVSAQTIRVVVAPPSTRHALGESRRRSRRSRRAAGRACWARRLAWRAINAHGDIEARPSRDGTPLVNYAMRCLRVRPELNSQAGVQILPAPYAPHAPTARSSSTLPGRGPTASATFVRGTGRKRVPDRSGLTRAIHARACSGQPVPRRRRQLRPIEPALTCTLALSGVANSGARPAGAHGDVVAAAVGQSFDADRVRVRILERLSAREVSTPSNCTSGSPGQQLARLR